MRRIVGSVDVLLVTPAAYEPVIKMAPPGIKIFNVFDRIGQLSLRMIQTRISPKLATRQDFVR